MIHTNYGYRISDLKEGTDYNWLFLPGGPGSGSEYLMDFCREC
jgi:hypothetical protein